MPTMTFSLPLVLTVSEFLRDQDGICWTQSPLIMSSYITLISFKILKKSQPSKWKLIPLRTKYKCKCLIEPLPPLSSSSSLIGVTRKKVPHSLFKLTVKTGWKESTFPVTVAHLSREMTAVTQRKQHSFDSELQLAWPTKRSRAVFKKQTKKKTLDKL